MITRTLLATVLAGSLSLIVSAVVCSGCASSESAGIAAPPDNSGGGTSSGSNASTASGDTSVFFADASVSTPAVGLVEGSPLCNASHVGSICYPDDIATAVACNLAPDGSTGYDVDAGYADAAVSCHVTPQADSGAEAGVVPACSVAGTGGDGAHCESSADCAPTYECVGAGTCRRYCCYSPCDSVHFCDVQPELLPEGGAPVPVPVCMPIRPCDLLANITDGGGGCDPGTQTCAVVSLFNGNALTSCVTNGDAGVDASCDTEHCAAGLMCSVGTSANRRCFKLCQTEDASSDCPASEVCTGGLPVFPDPMTGICAPPLGADL